jgi:hypothetical protein
MFEEVVQESLVVEVGGRDASTSSSKEANTRGGAHPSTRRPGGRRKTDGASLMPK